MDAVVAEVTKRLLKPEDASTVSLQHLSDSLWAFATLAQQCNLPHPPKPFLVLAAEAMQQRLDLQEGSADFLPPMLCTARDITDTLWALAVLGNLPLFLPQSAACQSAHALLLRHAAGHDSAYLHLHSCVHCQQLLFPACAFPSQMWSFASVTSSSAVCNCTSIFLSSTSLSLLMQSCVAYACLLPATYSTAAVWQQPLLTPSLPFFPIPGLLLLLPALFLIAG